MKIEYKGHRPTKYLDDVLDGEVFMIGGDVWLATPDEQHVCLSDPSLYTENLPDGKITVEILDVTLVINN
jgi:hypothetical protein